MAIACFFGAGLATTTAATAAISPVQAIEGPASEVIEVSDAAMAEDGGGGVVYLKQEGGRAHVFVARFRDGVWSVPQRVDVGQDFDSSWARIAAGDGGRLLVTWVQEFGTGSDRIYSATLDPGAKGFQTPVPVDLNAGEATATFPDLVMNAGGQAYLTYLVITDESPLNPPGFLGIDVKVARYNNRLWSVLGNPADRNPAAPMPKPNADAGPKIGIDSSGQAVVAWREPDDEFVNRVWARRVFGTSVGVPLMVSPSIWDGAPLRGEADAFDLDDGGFGQVAVAFRQQPGQGSKLNAPRIFVNEMPDAFAQGAGAFAGARLIDGGAQGGLGAPSVAVEPEGGFFSGFSTGPATLLASGDNASIDSADRLDDGGSSIPGEPLVDIGASLAGVAAWKELRGGAGSVAVREQRADGVAESDALSAPGAGAIGRLALGGSGLGDAIVAWRQGGGDRASIAAAVVDAPPDPFLVEIPGGWQRRAQARVKWNAAENAIGTLRYSVSIDDEQIGKRTTRLSARLKTKRIGDGRHKLQIFAIDGSGQETGSRKGLLLVDGRRPQVRLRARRERVAVIVSDRTSGVKGRSVKVSFGDSGRARASALLSRRRSHRPRPVVIRHTYSSPGRYLITVEARDRAGNKVSFRREVRAR